MSIPARLYKYRPINERTERIIRDNQLYFSSPLDFNDPFEGRIFPDFTGTEDQHRRFLELTFSRHGLTGKELDDKVQEHIHRGTLMDPYQAAQFSEATTERIMDRVSTLCFSEAKDGILGWAHYADNHRGICLEFSTADPNSYFSKVRQVEYVPDYPILRMFLDSPEEKIRKFILTKYDHWLHEAEWRVFEVMDDGFLRRPGLYDFPPASLTGVIFGCRMTDDEIRNVLPWFEGRDPQPSFYRAGVKAREFGLEIGPLNI